MTIDVAQTQLICWTLYHLYWEVEKGTKRYHTRAPPPAGPWAWQGRRCACRAGMGKGMARRGRQAACVCARMEWERFYHFLFNAKRFHKCWSTSTPGNYAAGAPSPPGSWLTREPLYIAPSGHPSVKEIQHAAHRHSRPMACAHRTLGE
jgi:hypothetical protein